ncbi:MAG: sulfotransferase, partial [Actinomycetia bacterium]|nr:sulfotransferase [Actinomycetes bacterium]
DPHAYGRYWAARVEAMLRACTDDRDLLPAERTIDVHFRRFMENDLATVRDIYSVAGQPFTDLSLSEMRSFIARHQRGKHGRITYNLTDFGLDERERREALRFYVERFGVDEEPLNA